MSGEIYQNSFSNNVLFPSINSSYHSSSRTNSSGNSRPKLIQYIDANIIGKDKIFNGPWGPRQSKIIPCVRDQEDCISHFSQ